MKKKHRYTSTVSYNNWVCSPQLTSTVAHCPPLFSSCSSTQTHTQSNTQQGKARKCTLIMHACCEMSVLNVSLPLSYCFSHSFLYKKQREMLCTRFSQPTSKFPSAVHVLNSFIRQREKDRLRRMMCVCLTPPHSLALKRFSFYLRNEITKRK